jgi:Skp family chaperone for outer membrane proteins
VAKEQTLLVVDVARVLDQSRAGQAGALKLRKRADAAKATHQGMRDAVAAAAFEREAVVEIERERAALREALLATIQSVTEMVRLKRGATVVVDRGVVLAVDPAADVTAEVIALLDAATGSGASPAAPGPQAAKKA